MIMNGNVDGVMGAATLIPPSAMPPYIRAPRGARWGTMEKTVFAQRGPDEAAERFPTAQGGGGIAIRCYQVSYKIRP